ncbi:MAG: metallophosphoesterase [Clostridia bacterium]|nr:metallophosphoesterase [Clostridia bacterium]
MKLGLFSDPHTSTKDTACGTRRPSLSFEKIREAMEAFRDAGADYVICLGDLVDECDTMEENTAVLTGLAAMIRSYGIPCDFVTGNHDYQNFPLSEFRRLTGDDPGSAAFVRRCGTKTLIFLDANYADTGEVYRRDAFDWTNASVPPEQRDLLQDILAMPETEEAYVFVHQNLDPTVESHHIIRNAEEIRTILRDSGKVKAVFQGHYHPGKESVIDGIPYHTLPAMCEGEENRYMITEI